MSTITFEFCHEKMVRDLRRAALGLAMFVGITMLAHCGTGCRPATAPSAADDYETRIIACAATSGYPGAYDYAADMRCRNGVNCEFGLPSCVKP